jgi:asparagine synthase (glutamine-hydrolysing)
LDRDFVEAVIQLDPSIKRTKEEKKVLRDAFSGYLPDDILRRPKDAFSDAVGYGWVDHVKAHGNSIMPEVMYGIVMYNTSGHNTPQSGEEAWYRAQFWQHFGRENDHLLTEMWRPMWTDQTDPCARYLKVNGDD